MTDRPVGKTTAAITIFLCGDVMTGRGVDQILPNPSDPVLYERFVDTAVTYVELAEAANGTISRPVDFEYIWGDALRELQKRAPDARIINLETAVTKSCSPELKGINYKMNPANIPAITGAGIDCCALANNHVLDWGTEGLLETLAVLGRAGLQSAGAGKDAREASKPAIVPLPQGDARLLIYGICTPSSGVPLSWCAGQERAGVNLIEHITENSTEALSHEILARRQPRDIIIASIHWGGNWGYEVPDSHRAFAHALVDSGAIDVVHGHSSHHPMGVEVYRGKLILYGCGDLLNDYEGIRGYEEFRPGLGLMYFTTLEPDCGKLRRLEMVPTKMCNLRLERATREETRWLKALLDREGARFSTGARLNDANCLELVWHEAPDQPSAQRTR
jgi:poly-gamma-glutamate capsule biosynthesis protein CapA/YwtB (metallophosphatase superfamily)